jgi:ABC transport system ATP-binding/permease protein
VGSYFASKFLVLALIAVVQAALLFFIARAWCRPPGPPTLQWLTLAALAVAGTTVGLFFSALARSEEVATALAPIAAIPQIILAGVVAPLNGFVRFLAKGFIGVHWAQQALERLLPEADQALLGRQRQSFFIPWAIVLLQAAMGATATVIVLWRTKGKAASR